jgi:hypothetical protein
VLKARCGRRLRGDYDRLLDLLSGVLRDVTVASIGRLPLASGDLDRGRALVQQVGQQIGVDDVGLVVAALWPLYADDFMEIVTGWPGRPGRLSQLVRALDDATKAGTISTSFWMHLLTTCIVGAGPGRVAVQVFPDQGVARFRLDG